MSDAEIITILISFHFNSYRNFKHYYIFYIREHLKSYFPHTLSYNRFVEVMKRVAVPMLFFIKLVLMGECTDISFVDSTCIPVYHSKRIPHGKEHRVFKDHAEVGKSTMEMRLIYTAKLKSNPLTAKIVYNKLNFNNFKELLEYFSGH